MPLEHNGRNAARVSHVSDDGLVIYLELRNGMYATCSGEGADAFDLKPGDVVLFDDDGLELAPKDLWREESWVGVVRLKIANRAVIDASGRLRIVDHKNNVEFREGNTVEVLDGRGIVAVLSEEPIRYLDLPSIDDATIKAFKRPKKEKPLAFEDFGGYPEIVARVRELIEYPLKYSDALASIGADTIKGVLLVGPPGTGKTLLARIIADNIGARFYEIRGPEVFSKWYGQSEQIVRMLFDDARQEPSIVFFDEIDSVATQRGNESHEVSKRVVAQLLTSMDSLTAASKVIVVATTNRREDIDAALLRSGRFDWIIEFPLPNKADREAILESSARHLSYDGSLPYALIAERTDAWSAADLKSIWGEAALLAAADGRSALVAEDCIGGLERVAENKRARANSDQPRNEA